MFDHSCGHDKQQPSGLNAENMLKTMGGGATVNTQVNSDQRGKWVFGPHSHTLKPGGGCSILLFRKMNVALLG
jgi:hypothetical protein